MGKLKKDKIVLQIEDEYGEVFSLLIDEKDKEKIEHLVNVGTRDYYDLIEDEKTEQELLEEYGIEGVYDYIEYLIDKEIEKGSAIEYIEVYTKYI